MAKEGWLFVGPGLAITGLATVAALSGFDPVWAIAVLALLASVYLSYFFRDPVRRAPMDDSVVVAPADGKILLVASLPDGSTRIDTFLSVWDVHVNRAPVGGQVVSCDYRPGKFFAAMKPEAGAENERQDVVLESPMGTVRFAQIAGTLARRIVCRLQPGDRVKTGDRIGMIRFGSRMEVIVPQGTVPTVVVGQKVRAGESVIARYPIAESSV
jgi:phosphatidylserine decarboxylase